MIMNTFDFSETNNIPCAQTICEQLAPFTNGWKAKSLREGYSKPHNHGTLVSTGKHLLHISADGYGTKLRTLHVSGGWPKTEKGDSTYPYQSNHDKVPDFKKDGINISLKKSPEKAWVEITKRFLPGYFEMFKLMKDRADTSDKYDRGCNEIGNQIEKVTPNSFERPSQNLSDNFSKHFRYRTKHEGYGKLEVTGPDDISITLSSISTKLAFKIIKVIEKFEKAESSK